MGDLDDAGFEEWFRQLLPDAIAVGRRMLGSQEEAEDVASEAFARALARWNRIGRLDHRDAWLLRTVTNACIDVIRRRAKAPIPPQATSLGTDLADAAALRATLAAALDALPRRQRQVVVLRHLAEWPPERVASSLGLTANTVKKHNDRAMTALRSSIGSTREAFDAL